MLCTSIHIISLWTWLSSNFFSQRYCSLRLFMQYTCCVWYSCNNISELITINDCSYHFHLQCSKYTLNPITIVRTEYYSVVNAIDEKTVIIIWDQVINPISAVISPTYLSNWVWQLKGELPGTVCHGSNCSSFLCNATAHAEFTMR